MNGDHFDHDKEIARLQRNLAAMTDAKNKALEALREVADMIQYETSFESPAYKRCWELIAELEKVK